MSAPLIPPHDLEAEGALLSTILLRAEDRARIELRPTDFYSVAHRRIAEAIAALDAAGTAVDIVNVGSKIRDNGHMADIGGVAYLAQVLDASPTVANPEEYAARIRVLARRREMIAACARIQREAYDAPSDFFERAEAEVFAITSACAQGIESTCSLLGDSVRSIVQAMSDQKPVKRIPTGIGSLDKILIGWRDDDLVVVAARPGMGKSAFACGAAVHVAMHEYPEEAHASLIMSAEMSREEIGERVLSARAQVDSQHIQTHALDNGEMSRLFQATGEMQDVPCWVDDVPSPTIEQIASRIRWVKAELSRWVHPEGKPYRLAMVVVDHLQIVGTAEKENTSRTREIGKFTAGLKRIAKSEHLTVMALSQLSRKVEERADKRPMLSDLRESGDVEQDADRVICLYRDAYYNKQAPRKDIAEAIVRKARGGRAGTAFVKWTGAYTQFSELTPSEIRELENEREAPAPMTRWGAK